MSSYPADLEMLPILARNQVLPCTCLPGPVRSRNRRKGLGNLGTCSQQVIWLQDFKFSVPFHSLSNQVLHYIFHTFEIGILGILGCWVLIFSSHFVPLGCSTVLLPARVVQALNLNFEDMGSHSQPHFNGGVAPDYGKTPHQYNHMVEAC